MHHIKSEISTFHLSLAKPEFNLYLASLAVYGYGQTLSDFFFLASIGSQDDFAQTQPAHSMRERLQSISRRCMASWKQQTFVHKIV